MKNQTDFLKKSYPGRQYQIDQLWNFFGIKDEPFPATLYLHGGPSTGKSAVVEAVLDTLCIRHAIINLIECYTPKLLFESILNKLSGHKIDHNIGTPIAKCDNLMDFLSYVRSSNEADYVRNSVIVIDKAEELRNMEYNILPTFLTLQELTCLPVTVIFLSEIVFEKFYYRLNIAEPIKMHFPQYSREEFLDILSLDFNYMQKLIADECSDFIEIDMEFYTSYLNIFLSVFYRACRDLRELKHMNRKNFMTYCEPIFKGELTVHDSLTLWKRISSVFSASSEILYLRVSAGSKDFGNLAQQLELPFYAKYLLIAAYLASYNSVKDDKKLFMKYHGKKTKTQKDIKLKSKVSEQLNTQMGPSAFTLDRLLAIFYSILEDKVGFNNHLLVQVSSLVELQLLSLVSDGSNLDGRRYKCNVNFETIQGVSKMVGFNVRKYLSDFSHM